MDLVQELHERSHRERERKKHAMSVAGWAPRLQVKERYPLQFNTLDETKPHTRCPPTKAVMKDSRPRLGFRV